jgi:dephospho-CoA kinase
VIVELVGLPGSGKTYLAPRLAEQHGIRIIRVGRLGQRHLYAWLFALLNPKLTRALRALCREQSTGNARLLRMNLHRLTSALAKLQRARVMRRGLIDEGILQVVLAAYERPAADAELQAILAQISSEDLCIRFVTADTDTRFRRMHARNKVPRAELGPGYQARWDAVQTQNAALLLRVVRERFACEVIDNSGAGISA